MHIVEQIAVRLGLDSSEYNSSVDKTVKKSKELDNSLAMSEKEAKSLGMRLEILSTELSMVLKGVAGLGVVIGAFTGLSKLVSEAQKVNNELFFLEKNLGMSAQSIKAWQGAANAGGGSAEGMTSSMKGLNKSMNDFVVRGDTTLLPFMNALGVSMVDNKGKLKDTDAMMLDLADSFSKMDREQAFSIGQDMGFDEGTLNVLLQGRDALKESLEYQKQMYVSSEKELEASRELSKNTAQLQAHWESMKLMMGNAIIPLLVKLTAVAKIFFEFLQRHQETVQNVFEAMGIIIGAVLIPILGKALIAALAFIAPFAPFILVVTALSAAFIALYDDYKTWSEGGNSLFNWGAFRDYIDNASLSTDNLKNAFKNLSKEVMSGAIPTLKGYADIVKMLASGDFAGAGKLAFDMTKEYYKNVAGVIDDITGQEKGTLANAATNLFSSKGGSSVSGGGNSASLLDMIAKGEVGTTAASGYNTAYRGSRVSAKSVFGKELNQLTIGQVKQLQKLSLREQASRGIPASKRSSAMGRYQFINTGFDDYINAAKLSDKDLFSPENQDAMAMAMIRKGKYGLDAVQSGKATMDQFQDKVLAARWASIKTTSGKGLYDNDGINKASHGSRQSVAEAARKAMGQINGGNASLGNTQSSSRTNNVDVKVGDIKVYTTASTISGTSADAMSSVSSQVNQLVGSMA